MKRSKNVWRCLLCLPIMFIFAVLQTAFAASVNGVRVWRAPDHTRLVIDLDAPVEHKLFTLPSPNRRLVVDIENTSMPNSPNGLDLADTPITTLRYGVRKNKNLRVVLDLNREIKPRSFVLAKHGDKPDRLVIDLYDVGALKARTIKDVGGIREEQRDVVIAIDAGHGGEDPGALGPGRIREKDVVLKISKELARLVNAERGYKGKLVRTGDYYIPLRKRRDKARAMRADLLISIHADAFKNPKARGASVFALSNRGATSETAGFLARKENEADLIGGVGGVSLDDKDDVLAGVLVDLSMTATLETSLNVGSRVLSRVGTVNKLHKRQVEQAGFAVLKSPDVPSILVETGFISNPGEAKKLGTDQHRKKIARAIFQGVKHYFSESPPDGTYLASLQNSNNTSIEYVISKGDTLSGIAKRYKVSVNDIKEANRLSGATIRVGQKLTIPAS